MEEIQAVPRSTLAHEFMASCREKLCCNCLSTDAASAAPKQKIAQRRIVSTSLTCLLPYCYVVKYYILILY